MTIDRADIIRGPAIITFKSQTFYTEGDITLTPNLSTFKINTAALGEVDERLDDIITDISFKPAGVWTAAQIAVLWPYANPTIGASVFGASDSDVTIQTIAGQLLTFKAGAITAMPDIVLSANKPMIGDVTITCIGANETAWTDDAKRASVSANAFSDTSFDPTQVFTIPYAAAWGGDAPWSAIETEDGWTITHDLQLDDVGTDSNGLVDRSVRSVGVMAKCTPVGVSEAQLLALLKIQGAGIQRGASLGSNANDLVIQGASTGDPKVTVANAAPKEAGFRFGATTLRAGEIGFVAITKITTGARVALYAYTTVPES